MTRRRVPDLDSASGRAYGFGVHAGQLCGWDYFGHVGRFQGTVSRVAVFPQIDLSVALLVNAIDGPAVQWLDGIAHILRRFHNMGTPGGDAKGWTGRWWNIWGPVDFVALGERVLAFNPAAFPPFSEASEITLDGPDSGRVTRAPAMERFGERVLRVRREDGTVSFIQIGGAAYVTEGACCSGLSHRYASQGC